MRQYLKNFVSGSFWWLGAVVSAMAAWTCVSFGAAAWGNLPGVTTATPVSASAWNDLVNQSNAIAGALGISSGDVSLSAGKTLTAGKVALSDVVTSGSACTTAGGLSKDSSGTPQVCKSGTWQPLAIGASSWACPSGQTLNVCLYHEHYSPSYGWSNSGWQCAPLWSATAKVWFGDDTGYTNQSAQVKLVCL